MTELFKTALRGAACLTLMASATLALPGTPWKRAELFATCSGRLAAMAAHQQAMDQPGWTATLDRRDSFDLMLEATLPEAIAHGVPRDEAKRWRAHGWTEIAVLLADSSYSFDEGRARRARAALQARIGDCQSVLLGG
ncbi:MAG: hypothetical protein ACP5DX_14475 [Paracoccaceae bacterium]|jgi:hypothetical protein